MIYAAALLCDLGIRPIHTAPVTAPLPACSPRTEPSVQNANFTSHPENLNFFFKKKKEKRIQSIQRQNLENYMICRAGAAGLGTPLTRELNCTHRRLQHLSFVGVQPFFSPRYFCNSLQRKQQMIKHLTWTQMEATRLGLHRGRGGHMLLFGNI